MCKKRFIIIWLVFVVSLFNTYAQSSNINLYSSYENAEGVSAFKFDRSLLKVVMLLKSNDLKPIKPLIKQTDTLAVMMFDTNTDATVSDNFWKDAQAPSIDQCPLFTELSADGESARIFVKMSQDTIKRCIIVTGGSNKSYIDLQGTYSLQDIQKLIE